ncbi:hypothetical protein Tco_1353023 [Tanacetum coccineum]
MASNPENVRLNVLMKLQEALDEEAILEEQILSLMHRFADRFTDRRVEINNLMVLHDHPLIDCGKYTFGCMRGADMKKCVYLKSVRDELLRKDYLLSNALGYSTFRCYPDLGVLQIGIRAKVIENQQSCPVMSSASSAVTYTSVYTDSEPDRVFWGADEEISNRGSPRVIVYGYDGLPMQLVAPPSPDYIPDPEEPHTPPVPHDEDEPEEQPLPPVDSPTAESPGYVAESDPEEDPEEYEDDETEDGPVD